MLFKRKKINIYMCKSCSVSILWDNILKSIKNMKNNLFWKQTWWHWLNTWFSSGIMHAFMIKNRFRSFVPRKKILIHNYNWLLWLPWEKHPPKWAIHILPKVRLANPRPITFHSSWVRPYLLVWPLRCSGWWWWWFSLHWSPNGANSSKF